MKNNEEQVWTKLSPHSFEDAAYNNPLVHHVFIKQVELIHSLFSSNDVLVDVGCGTGKFFEAIIDEVLLAVGLDISQEFLNLAKSKNIDHSKTVFVQGDATELNAILHAHPELTTHFWQHKRIVTCVLNTLGIMPASIRQSVINEMVQLAGEDGTVFLSVFNADYFSHGIEDFYRKVPNLCGLFDEKDINRETCEIKNTQTGYYTHWFSVPEIKQLFSNAGITQVDIKQSGVGIFVTGKKTSL